MERGGLQAPCLKLEPMPPAISLFSYGNRRMVAAATINGKKVRLFESPSEDSSTPKYTTGISLLRPNWGGLALNLDLGVPAE